MKLFISLYLDEDVDVLIAELIRHEGFEATTARDEGQLGKTDAEQLAYAVSREMCIVVHNRDDYAELIQDYFDAHRTHYGVVIATRQSPHAIALKLLGLLDVVATDEMMNQVRYL
jgi:hypothetical protein